MRSAHSSSSGDQYREPFVRLAAEQHRARLFQLLLAGAIVLPLCDVPVVDVDHAIERHLRRDDQSAHESPALVGEDMCAPAPTVCLRDPFGKLRVELRRPDDPEVMHEEPLRVRAGTSNARILDTTLQVEIAVERCMTRLQAGEPTSAPLQADRRLRHRIGEWTTRRDQLDEAVVEANDVVGLVAQMPFDRPLVGHVTRLAGSLASA